MIQVGAGTVTSCTAASFASVVPLGLVKADHVAGRVAEGAVARAPGLDDGFLEDLRAGGPDRLERGVEIVRAEYEDREGALDEQLLEGVAVVLGAAGVRDGEHQFQTGLGRAAEGDPALTVRADVVAHFQAEHVPVEGERFVEVVDGDL